MADRSRNNRISDTQSITDTWTQPWVKSIFLPHSLSHWFPPGPERDPVRYRKYFTATSFNLESNTRTEWIHANPFSMIIFHSVIFVYLFEMGMERLFCFVISPVDNPPWIRPGPDLEIFHRYRTPIVFLFFIQLGRLHRSIERVDSDGRIDRLLLLGVTEASALPRYFVITGSETNQKQETPKRDRRGSKGGVEMEREAAATTIYETHAIYCDVVDLVYDLHASLSRISRNTPLAHLLRHGFSFFSLVGLFLVYYFFLFEWRSDAPPPRTAPHRTAVSSVSPRPRSFHWSEKNLTQFGNRKR